MTRHVSLGTGLGRKSVVQGVRMSKRRGAGIVPAIGWSLPVLMLATGLSAARADEIATLIAKKPPVAVQGSVRAIWEALDLPRSTAIMNALIYTQLGNPIGTAQLDRGSAPKSKWTLR